MNAAPTQLSLEVSQNRKISVAKAVAVVLIVAASCLRIFICLQHNPMDYLWSDPLRHWFNGHRFPRGGYSGAADPILYQVYVSALSHLTRDNRFLVGLMSGLLSAFMPWTYYRAVRSFGVQKLASLWLWVLVAWTPSLFTIYHYMMMETLLLVMEGAALWMTARYLRKGGTEAFLVSVFFWTLACLTKPTIIPLAAVCLLWSFWKKRPSARATITAAVMAMLLFMPQAIRSKLELGFFAPFGNPWLTKIQHRSGVRIIYVHFHGHPNDINMWYSSPVCYIRPLWPFSSWTIERTRENSSLTITASADNGDHDWKNAYAALDVRAGQWLNQWKENIIVILFAPSWPEHDSQQWDSRLEFWARWLWAPLILLVLAYNVREILNRRFDLLPIAITIFTLFLVLQNVATSEGRYRKPLEPLLLLNVVWLISGSRKSAQERPAISENS